MSADSLQMRYQYANRLAFGGASNSIVDILARLRSSEESSPSDSSPSSNSASPSPINLNDCIISVSRDSSHLAVGHGLDLYLTSPHQYAAHHRSHHSSLKQSKSSFAKVEIRIESVDDRTYSRGGYETRLQATDEITDMAWIQMSTNEGTTGSTSATSSVSSSSSSASSSSASSASMMEWILLVGFSNGFIRAYRSNGTPLFTQRLQSGSVRRIRVRTSRMNRLIPTSATTTELLVLYSQAVVWVEGRSLANSIRDAVTAIATMPLGENEGDSISSASLYPWSFRAYETTQQMEDVLPIDYDSDDLFGSAAFPSNPTAGFIAGGVEPSLSLYLPRSSTDGSDLQQTRPHSTRGAIKLAASKLTSAVFTMAKTWWQSDGPEETSPEPQLPSPDHVEPERCLRDSTRQVTLLASDERDEYLLTADNFGRVCLIDRQSFVIVRMWKGYRDAQCCIIRVHSSNADAKPSLPPSSSSPSAGGPVNSSSSSATVKSSKSKKSRTKLTVIQHVDDDTSASDIDFDSHLSSTANISPMPSASPASLSTKVPTLVRSPPKPYLLLYAPRRGQLELWSLPYGARLGAKNVGFGCRLLTGLAHSESGEVTAELIRKDGTIQSIVIRPSSVNRPPVPQVEPIVDPCEEEDIAMSHELESMIYNWSTHHDACRGYACAARDFDPVDDVVTRWSARLQSRLPNGDGSHVDKEWAPRPTMPESHLRRITELIRQSATRLWSKLESDPSVNLCPRLAEAILQATEKLLTRAIELTKSDQQVDETEIILESATSVTTITVTRPSAIDGDRRSRSRVGNLTGMCIRAQSEVLMQGEALRQEVRGWLHLLAVYHIACAPGGVASASASTSSARAIEGEDCSLKQFIDCFAPRWSDFDQTTAIDTRSDKSQLKTNENDTTSKSFNHTKLLRFTLTDDLTQALVASDRLQSAASSSFATSQSTLRLLANILFGSPAALAASDFLASKTLDLLLHLDSTPIDRGTIVDLLASSWWIQLSAPAMEGMLTGTDDWTKARKQVELLLQALVSPPIASMNMQAHADGPERKLPNNLTPIQPIGTLLSKVISFTFYSPALDHISALLRFVRTVIVKPHLEAYIREDTLMRGRLADGEITDDDGLQPLLTDSMNFLSMVDLSTRVLHRHVCQLQLLRHNFPQSSLTPTTLTLANFVQSHPLSRLVAMHLVARSPASVHEETGVAKEEIHDKLRAFEDVFAAAADQELTEDASMKKDVVAVSSIAGIRARVAGDKSHANDTVTLPLSAWDWKLTADEASVTLYAAIQSLQRWISFSHASLSPASPIDLLRCVGYLESLPPSSVSGGFAAWIWLRILSPHIRALVHSAQVDSTTSSSTPTTSSSKLTPSSLATATAAKKKAAASMTYVKALKLAASTHSTNGSSKYLIDFADLDSLRTLFNVAQRTLTYLGTCFTSEEKDLAWEGTPNYFCPAIAQTIDYKGQQTLPIRQADHATKYKTTNVTPTTKFTPSSTISASAQSSARTREASTTAAAAAAATHVSSVDRFNSALVHPEDGPPPYANTNQLCTSLFHSHVRYTHPEANIPYANIRK